MRLLGFTTDPVAAVSGVPLIGFHFSLADFLLFEVIIKGSLNEVLS